MSFLASISPWPWNPSGFSTAKIPELTGKIYAVTGGNTGIGFHTCKELARKGAIVYLLARSEQKAMDAIDSIKKEIPSAILFWIHLDLQDLKSVESAAKSLQSRTTKLDVLINNAGISYTSFGLTKDGIEDQFGTNHVGPFFLTQQLIPLLLQAEEPRIINVSSWAHIHSNGIQVDKRNDPSIGNPYSRYADSKLANILFTKALCKRFPSIYSTSLHPGVVHTEILRNVDGWSPLLGSILRFGSRFVSLTAFQGSLTTLYCATSPDIPNNGWNGQYFTCIALLDTPSKAALNEEAAIALWEESEQLLKKLLN
jgi:NAD(P)-dependent dehydrogenase (short-subunit alcohol dehydrogenase family)